MESLHLRSIGQIFSTDERAEASLVFGPLYLLRVKWGRSDITVGRQKIE